MKRIFRSRLPPPLTSTQLKYLSEQSHFTNEEVQEWYDRFNHCYPRGYLTSKDFFMHLQQFHRQNRINNSPPTKLMVKQHFRVLDLNEDKHLNFEEFFLFYLLINQDSTEEKLKLLLTLYDRDQTKYLTKQQMENILINMFDLLNLSKSKIGLTQRLDTILTRVNINTQNEKISWYIFSSSVVNNRSLFQFLISNHVEDNLVDDNESPWIITRF